jgi:hypothetical protein
VKLGEQQRERLLHQRQPVRRVHRARRVDEEHQVCPRPAGRLDRIPLDADADELATLGPWAREYRNRGAERLVCRRGSLIRIGEIIDQLFGPYCRRRRQDIAIERGANERVGRRVDVERERGDRCLPHDFEGVLGRARELVAAGRLGGRGGVRTARRQVRRSTRNTLRGRRGAVGKRTDQTLARSRGRRRRRGRRERLRCSRSFTLHLRGERGCGARVGVFGARGLAFDHLRGAHRCMVRTLRLRRRREIDQRARTGDKTDEAGGNQTTHLHGGSPVRRPHRGRPPHGTRVALDSLAVRRIIIVEARERALDRPILGLR